MPRARSNKRPAATVDVPAGDVMIPTLPPARGPDHRGIVGAKNVTPELITNWYNQIQTATKVPNMAKLLREGCKITWRLTTNPEDERDHDVELVWVKSDGSDLLPPGTTNRNVRFLTPPMRVSKNYMSMESITAPNQNGSAKKLDEMKSTLYAEAHEDYAADYDLCATAFNQVINIERAEFLAANRKYLSKYLNSAERAMSEEALYEAIIAAYPVVDNNSHWPQHFNRCQKRLTNASKEKNGLPISAVDQAMLLEIDDEYKTITNAMMMSARGGKPLKLNPMPIALPNRTSADIREHGLINPGAIVCMSMSLMNIHAKDQGKNPSCRTVPYYPEGIYLLSNGPPHNSGPMLFNFIGDDPEEPKVVKPKTAPPEEEESEEPKTIKQRKPNFSSIKFPPESSESEEEDPTPPVVKRRKLKSGTVNELQDSEPVEDTPIAPMTLSTDTKLHLGVSMLGDTDSE